MTGFIEVYITLPTDRSNVGELIIRDELGNTVFEAIPVYGAADRTQAELANNPTRDPLQKFGNTPYGFYSIGLPIPSPPGSILGDRRGKSGLLTYGTEGVVRMTPLGGDALTAAQNGRTGLLIHSGDLNKAGKMRPTNGCIRVRPGDMAALTAKLSTLLTERGAQCSVVEGYVTISQEAPPLGALCEDEPADPPPETVLDDAEAEQKRRAQEQADADALEAAKAKQAEADEQARQEAAKTVAVALAAQTMEAQRVAAAAIQAAQKAQYDAAQLQLVEIQRAAAEAARLSAEQRQASQAAAAASAAAQAAATAAFQAEQARQIQAQIEYAAAQQRAAAEAAERAMREEDLRRAAELLRQQQQAGGSSSVPGVGGPSIGGQT